MTHLHSLQPKLRRSLSLVAVAALATGPVLAESQAPPVESHDLYISEASVPHVLNVDLRTLPRATKWQPGDPIEVVPEQTFADYGVDADPDWVDETRQRDVPDGVSFSGTLINDWPGLAWTGGNPPDVVGDVGPNHYIGMVNASRFIIWDKQGNILVGETFLRTLWDGGSSPCADGDGDPIVRYDGLADRWMMSEFDLSGNTFCIYISQSPDPVSGGWFAYEFSAPSFPDYPQYGVWPDAYYVSSYESPVLGIYAFDRASMLAGQPATFQRFTVPQLNGSAPRVTRILPTDLDGPAPPNGAPAMFARTVDATQDSSDPNDRIEIWEYSVDWVTPANSSLTLLQSIPTTFQLLACSPGVRDCVPQPGTGNMIDALFNRAMRRLQYRNFGDYETMLMTQVVDAGGGVGGMHWWELRRSLLAEGGTWSIHQESTYSPDSTYRFMGSIAMNGNGEMALGYSVSDGTSVVPGIRVTARRPSDPLNTMTMEELTINPGNGVQTISQRWGDYTSMNVDPSDDLTFWYINEVLQENGTYITHVGVFSLGSLFEDGFESGDASRWSSQVP